MTIYDDFDGDEKVIMPRRGYTDITRQDSSVELRNRFRSFWGLGEHLWDVDYNNNLAMLADWMGVNLHNWRLPTAPWINHPDMHHRIQRGGPYNDFVAFQQNEDETFYLIPFPGAKIYSRADRTMIAYTGSAWRPVLYNLHYRPEIEVSLFASMPRAGEVCARHVATAKFEITGEGLGGKSPFSRFRASKETAIEFFKNGVKCGDAIYSNVGFESGRVIPTATTVFDVGDELSIKAPDPLRGVTWLSISFMGRVIQE
jgi:hypothetical protein